MIQLDIILTLGGGLLILFAAVAAGVAWHAESGLIAMRRTPTLSAAEVAARHTWALRGAAPLGQAVEVLGTIECDEPLSAPYSETQCVAYEYSVHDERARTIKRPGARTTYKVEFGGRDDTSQRVKRFYVRDASGRVAVDPAGASIEMPETVARYEAYTGLGGSEHTIWREERALALGNRVFVLGYLCDDQGEPVIGRYPGAGQPFIISHRAEEALKARATAKTYGLYIGAVLGLAGAAVCFLWAYLT